ncbi:MAG: hypothetical protein E2O29_01935 [Deltaproteobacteria bacterium]|nr:MAG: hypothetical protein E2O29_01935 [Deltaproteobacteria bacterium]
MPTVQQNVTSDATIFGTVTQNLLSDATIQLITTQTVESDSIVLVEFTETIFSDAQITKNEPDLKLFASTAPTVEVGIESNPLVFTGVIAGEEFQHPDNPFQLFNDKGGGFESVDARDIQFRILSLELIDELQGASTGAASQTFTVAFPPVLDDDVLYPLIVRVGGIVYTRVDNLAGFGSTDEIYTFSFASGLLSFGDGVTGKIPPATQNITVTYSPNVKDFGSEVASQDWFGVQSSGIISNPVIVDLERQTSDTDTTVTVSHTPLIAVVGVFLNSDPNRLGTNFFTSGTFDGISGEITLGTALPSATEDVLIDYEYEIEDDAETTFSLIGQEIVHLFENPIPSNNAKLLNLSITPPTSASPSGILNIRFRIRVSFKG